MTAPHRNNETGSTREALVAAAAQAFNEAGFFGTDTNRIARAAGFAPQTFYRHFADKLDVFLAVYAAWETELAAAVARGARARNPAAGVADAVIAHHRQWSGFRRSLRLLAADDARVRSARAASRKRQVASLRALRGAGAVESLLIGDILCVERLADAMADGEWSELGIAATDARAQVVSAVERARGLKGSHDSGGRDR